MLSSIRSVASSFLQSWRYLPDEGTFSIRNWIRAQGSNWVYLTYRDDQAALLRPLVATLLELAITEGLSLSEDPSRDLWLIMDEVDSLGKVSTLRDGLSKLRKYGGKCVLGLQTISQLRSTYGEHEAQTLMANISTKVILRAGDGQTAEYFSTEIGDREVEVVTVGKTRSLSQATSTTTNRDRRVERTVLASEISGLPDLHGFLKIPEHLIRIEIEPQQYPENARAYIPRARSAQS
jgi:type IV secretory pathway TraG/TraD family ATPase VirD4